jgi:tetratricopeptide (TPR) repeat protein
MLKKTISTSVYLIVIIGLLIGASCGIIKKKDRLSDKKQLENSSLFIEAFRLNLLGRTDDALVLFKLIAESDPGHSASRYEIARIFALNKEYPKAVEYAKQAIHIDPVNKWYKMLLIDIYGRSGDHKAKISIYQQLLKEYPEDMSLYYGLADAHMQMGNLKEAIGVMNSIEDRIGITEEVSLQKYQYYLNMRDYAGAIEVVKVLSEAFPGESAYVLAIGDYYLQTGNYYEALLHYTKAYESDNSNYEALISMAECYMRIGNKEKATELFTLLFADASVDVDAKMDIMLYYYEISETDSIMKRQAYDLLDVYISSHPEEAKVYSVYGDFLFRDEKYKEAAQQWKQVTALDPSKFMVWEHIFICYEQLGDWETLEKEARVGIEYFPEQAASYLYAGLALYSMKKYTESFSFLKDASEIAVSDKQKRTQALNLLAESYYRAGEYENSFETYDILVHENPRNWLIINNYSYYLALQNRDLEKALEMSETTIKANSKSPNYLDTYGWILYMMGNYEESEKYLRQAVEYSAENRASILEHYGDVLFKLGNDQQSLIYWKKAIEMGGNAETIHQKIDQLQNNVQE